MQLFYAYPDDGKLPGDSLKLTIMPAHKGGDGGGDIYRPLNLTLTVLKPTEEIPLYGSQTI